MSADIITLSAPQPQTDGILRLEPTQDWIAIAVSHQSHNDNFGAGGLIMPEAWTKTSGKQPVGIAADESTSGDHYATIVGVGPDVLGLDFGHRVNVTRWADGQWFYDWPDGWPMIAADAGNDTRRIAIAPKARFAYIKPTDVVFIVSDFAGMAGWPHGLEPGKYPGPGRIFLAHDPPPAVGLGLADIQRNPYPTPWATVLDVWPGVEGIRAGDRVMCNDSPKCTFWPDKGVIYSMTRAQDVVLVEPAKAREVATG